MKRILLLSVVLIVWGAFMTDVLAKSKMLPKDLDTYPVIKVGDDLAKYVDQNVQIISEVSNTKQPSFGDYWLSVPLLEDYQGKKVHVWGKVIKVQESTTNEKGEIVQGRDGTFYHLEIVTFKVVE
ncbi:MAG: hypothetical protein ABII18_13755 [bacterium]|nr:hypothetical protein [bacterium]MBU1918717.1 hypothetical protein [bacterium]